MLAEPVVSCPCAKTGAEWKAISKGVSVVDSGESPGTSRVAGVNGFTELHLAEEEERPHPCGEDTSGWVCGDPEHLSLTQPV